jgi:hypothetical protein
MTHRLARRTARNESAMVVQYVDMILGTHEAQYPIKNPLRRLLALSAAVDPFNPITILRRQPSPQCNSATLLLT